MLRNLHRAQAWNTSGYVCRSCRLRLKRLQCQMPRWQSSTTPTQETADDWLSNFNDLSVEHSTLTQDKIGKDPSGPRGSGDGDGLQDGKRSRSKTKRGRGDIGIYLARLERTVNRSLPHGPSEVAGIKESGRQKIPRKVQSTSGHTARRRPRRPRRQKAPAASMEPESIPMNHKRHREQTAEVVNVNNATGEPQSTRFESLVDSLTKAFTNSLPGMFQKFQKTEEQTSAQTASMSEPDTNPLEVSARVAMPSFVSDTSSSPSFSRPRPSSRSRNQRSPVQMVRDSRDRPKWGGAVATRTADGNATPQAKTASDDADLMPLIRKLARDDPYIKHRKSDSTANGVDADLPANPTKTRPDHGGKSDANAIESALSRLEKPSSSRSNVISLLKDSLSSNFHKADSEISDIPKDFHERLAVVTQNVDYYRKPPSSRQGPQLAANMDEDGERTQIDAAAGKLASLHNMQATGSKSIGPANSKDQKPTDIPNSKTEVAKPKRTSKRAGRKERATPMLKETKETREPSATKGRIRKTKQAKMTASLAKASDDTSTSNMLPNGSADVDDGDHKPLWQVMADAKTGAAKPAESTETEMSNEQPTPLLMNATKSKAAKVVSIQPADLRVEPLGIPQPPVPVLEYGLDRVLFNPGVYQLQDPLSRVYNFEPYLQKIMPVAEFDYNALKEYKTSSQDTALSALAKEYDKRYIGSTSSMTGTLGHFHYLLSNFRELNLNMLSRGFSAQLSTNFTNINRAPNGMFLRWKNGTYAIDADKEYDGANVLMMLGKSMEKLLTMTTSDYERYRKSDPRSVSEEERTSPESYEYTTMNDFLMRSQLDAHDPRLPGTGMFDLKTRAVLSVRIDAEDFEPMTGYEIHSLYGRFGSYEREYYDMMRSTMLKYMLQVRMGRMDGIFIAYHNVERIFGFQYVPLQDMDRAIHGQSNTCLGDQEFKASLELMNKVLDKATEKFPEQSLRFHFATNTQTLFDSPTSVMWIFAEPMAEAEIERIQNSSKAHIAEFEKKMMGMEKDTTTSTEVAAKSEADVDTDRAMLSVKETAAKQVEARNQGQEHMEGPEADGRMRGASSESGDITSSTGADRKFIKSIASDNPAESDRRPLFVASLICKSRVNGSSVPRPENLKPDDKWEVEYLLEEWEPNDAMWAKYEQTKARRKELFQKYREDGQVDEEGNGIGEKKKKDGFITLLRAMSQHGRDFRGKMDELEAGKVPIVVGQALRPAANGDA